MAATAILHQRFHGSYYKNQVNRLNNSSFQSITNFSGNDGDDNSLQVDTQQQTQSRAPVIKASTETCRNSSGRKADASGSAGTSKGVSRAVLAQKYLLCFEEDNLAESQLDSGDNRISSNNIKSRTVPTLKPTKVPLKCLNIATKEWMQCKIIQRDDRGVNTLAAHDRLGECSDYVNPVSELLVTPKYFCLISPATYGNLHSYIYSKNNVKEAEARHLFEQMVSIVKFCHSKGVVLRDLKMGRFVFANKERTKIKLESLDEVVVLTRADSEDDLLDDRHGCPNYVSPEKTESVMKIGTKYGGKASDIWSLGVSLYAMLAGRYPFNDSDCGRLLTKIRSGSYTMVDGISPFAKSLIRCLLTKNSCDRPGCKEILKHPWFKTNDFQCAPTPIRLREDSERDFFKAKRMRLNDDQVVPGSVL